MGFMDIADYTTTSDVFDVAAPVAAISLGIIALMFLFVLVIYLISVIGLWKVFTKSGKPGWPALIPIYNTYTICKITGINAWWLLIVCVGCPIIGMIPVFGPFLSSAISIYFSVILYHSLSKSFGNEGVGFTIGLLILQPIFLIVLGFGNYKYVGEKACNDPIGDWFFGLFGNKENKNQSLNNTNSDSEKNEDNANTKFCSNCGAKLDDDSTFCSSCGTKQ